jgi:hypothetical protein
MARRDRGKRSGTTFVDGATAATSIIEQLNTSGESR